MSTSRPGKTASLASLEHAQAIQHRGRVRRELDAGADLAERGRLLEQVHGAARLRHGQRARQAADASADDKQVWLLHEC
jgi:hypothetical protein